MMNWSEPKRSTRCLVVLAAALTLACLFGQTTLFQRLNGWVEDAQHRLLGPELDMADIVIVDIDEESVEQLKQSLGAWPYSRDLYARVVRYLTSRNVRSIAFDILFSEPRAGDEEFADGLNANVVLAAAAFARPPLRGEGYLREFTGLSVAPNPVSGGDKENTETDPRSVRWSDITLPLAAFVQQGRARVGVISVRPDEDGTLRRIPLFHRAYGNLLPSFALATWASAQEIAQLRTAHDEIIIKGHRLPVNAEAEVTLRYPRALRNLTVIAFHQLVSAPQGAMKLSEFDARFAGKRVFIGSSSILFGDYAYTPLGRVSGLILSAIARQSLAAGNVMRPLPWDWSALLMLLALAPALVLTYREQSWSPVGFAGALVATAVLIVSTGMALFHLGWSAQWVFMLVAGLLALALAASYGVLRLRTEKRRLYVERKAAQEASRLKGEFLANMAHELRTPLTAIMGFNKINQLDDRLGHQQRVENSTIIARNCEHLLQLVNDNLEHAKIEAGQLNVSRVPENIEALVADVIATLRPLAAEKGLLLDGRCQQPLPETMMIDAFRVRQVLLNLAGNGLKFTQKGRVDVLVNWHDGRLKVNVVDTGPGIERSVAEKMFEPFQQGDPVQAMGQVGTGLGLTIARSLVRLMGGELQLDSWVGRGSRFHFWIPALEAPREVPALNAPSPDALPQLVGHVLLAEDDEDIRELMRRELLALGLSVHPVGNGLEAVHAAQAQRFDLVLMDIEMPIMSGLEAAQVLRAGGLQVPLLALTAHSQGPETEAAQQHGFNAILTKPLSTQRISDALAVYLGQVAKRREPHPRSHVSTESGL